jgi:NhaA family Na+:H+ antiporter
MTDNHLRTAPNTPIFRLVRPFQEFAARETSGGIVLLACTLAALIWANSPWAHSYETFWHTTVTVGAAGQIFTRNLHFWVNDGLMAIFFLVVGLEIKRELLVGELASVRQAALPIAGALGGVMFPAIIYTLMNRAGPGASGWGIPMATDIAFVIGIMALLGSRVPLGLKVFLTALAIVDDIAAVLVIAVFYTSEISFTALGTAGLCLAGLIVMNRLGVRHPLPYGLLGIALWYFVMQSGVHATIAGVVLALTIPSRTELNAGQFLSHSRAILDHLAATVDCEANVLNDENQQVAVDALEDTCEKLQPPMHRIQEALHPWVTFVIMPLFALANAGVNFGSHIAENIASPIALGVAVGLLLGKPLGITLASWLAVKGKVASLPDGVNWSQVHAAGWLGGIGFTMSLFIAALALSSETYLLQAKLGIFAGSLLAAVTGSFLMLRANNKAGESEANAAD